MASSSTDAPVDSTAQGSTIEEDPPSTEVKEKKPTSAKIRLLWGVLFFAYWFDPKSFDMDGDGDFDEEDVEAWLAEKGFLQQSKEQKRRSVEKKEKKEAQVRKSKAKHDAQRKEIEALSSGEDPAESAEQADVFPPPSETQPEWKKNKLDLNGDGKVDMDDMIAQRVEGEAVEDKIVQNLIEKKKLPWFILIQCLACFGLWLIWALITQAKEGGNALTTKAGLDSFFEEMTDLRVSDSECTDYRPQVWRWLTYQFTHVGAMHALMNVFLNLMLGIPLEGLHGRWRMLLMFNIGVFGGACMYFLTDAHVVVVGCSGGCYALIGMHIADLVMNWGQKKFRLATVIFLVMLIAMDIISYTLSLGSKDSSHSAHGGGALAGLIIGIIIGKNLRMHAFEKVFMIIAIGLGIVCALGSVIWVILNPSPLNVFEAMAGQDGYCWTRQIYNGTIDPDNWICIRCGTKECMHEWSQFNPNILKVDMAECVQKGFYYDGR